MGHRFQELAFTANVKALQQANGSRAAYARGEGGEDFNDVLGPAEQAFIAARDSFYLASVGETGWPYVQHRGGPAGFLRVLDERTLGFADFRGNRQYVSVGNLGHDGRVALFLMDYPNRTRLKLLGRARVVGDDEPALLAKLEVADYRARVERGIVITIEAFDWNCPQHITPRWTADEIAALAGTSPAATPDASTGATPATLGDGPLALVVSGVRQLTPRVREYELRAADGAVLPAVTAGAHVALPVRRADGTTVTRHYSIVSDPSDRDAWRIAVQREDDGRGGSRGVHDSYALGTRLNAGQPANRFALPDDARPRVLVAGGIGITPLRAMAATLAREGRDFHLHYAGRRRDSMAYAAEIQRTHGERVSLHVGDEGTRLDVARVLREAPADAVFLVCGPARLTDAVLAAARALGIDRARIRHERFVAPRIADPQPVELELRRSGLRLHVPATMPLLDAVEAAGVAVPSECRTGTCRTCAVRVLDGTPLHADTALSAPEHEAGDVLCLCVSRARTPSLALDL